MRTYLSLLKGINVGASHRILMSDLKGVYDSLGFKNSLTYVQSGNVVFQTHSRPEQELVFALETAFKNRFGFGIPTVLRSQAEWIRLCETNPFLKKTGLNPNQFHITFLAAEPTAEAIRRIPKKSQQDSWIQNGREIYLYCPNGYGRSKYSNTFFEKHLNLSATTRNWNTALALLALSDEISKQNKTERT
jgi:uncharacterized protein (DUF1697 family)